MSTGRSRLISVRPGLRLSALVLVLAGLFGMHGLDGHDAVAMGSVPQAVMAEMLTGSAVADAGGTDRLGSQVGHVDTQSRAEMTAVDGSGLGGMNMAMAAMCVAILAAALIALVRFLLGGRARRLLWVLSRQLRAVLQHAGRDSDPPSLIALSIQRC